MAPTLVKRPAIARARRLREAMTDGERKLWQSLKTFRILYGFHIRRQVPIGPYTADFACHSARLVIEIDGEWHDETRRRQTDKLRDEWMAQAGYRTLRISSGDLRENFDGCLNLILTDLGGLK